MSSRYGISLLAALIAGAYFEFSSALFTAHSESAWGRRPAWLGLLAVVGLCGWLVVSGKWFWLVWKRRQTGRCFAALLAGWLVLLACTYALVELAA